MLSVLLLTAIILWSHSISRCSSGLALAPSISHVRVLSALSSDWPAALWRGCCLALSFHGHYLYAVYLYARATAKQGRAITVTGKGFRPRQIDLRRWKYVA